MGQLQKPSSDLRVNMLLWTATNSPLCSDIVQLCKQRSRKKCHSQGKFADTHKVQQNICELGQETQIILVSAVVACAWIGAHEFILTVYWAPWENSRDRFWHIQSCCDGGSCILESYKSTVMRLHLYFRSIGTRNCIARHSRNMLAYLYTCGSLDTANIYT